MITGAAGQKYGLIKPGSASGQSKAKAGFFDDDDDEDDVKARLARSQAAHHNVTASSVPLNGDVDEDFDYDNWKEAEETNKARARATAATQSTAGGQNQPQARYIGSLLQKAKERELERERALERKLAREQEQEAAIYGETESFVTGAYAARLEERKGLEEQLKRKDAEDEDHDITKRSDMTGFYRNVLMGDSSAGSRAPASTATASAVSAGAGRTSGPAQPARAAEQHRPSAASSPAVSPHGAQGRGNAGRDYDEDMNDGRPSTGGGAGSSSGSSHAASAATAQTTDKQTREPFRSSEEDIAKAKAAAEARWAARKAAGAGRRAS